MTALNDESVRPIADRVTVQSAEIFNYRVEARLHLYDGAVAGPCLDAANAALTTYLNDQKKLGRSVCTKYYGAVLRVAGVEWVEMVEPASDIIMACTQSGFCTNTAVSVADDKGAG